MAHKLLLADDSVTIQRVIELTFADEDVQVIAVGDGRQAIERVERDRPDIVLADVGMPERDGYEVAAFIKSKPELAHIPVLLLTGAFEPVDDARAKSVGCDGVLVKPFEPQMVISRVKDLLSGRKPVSLWANTPAPVHARQPVPATGLHDLKSPSEPPPAPAGSLEDYFDRLDAAFATLDGGQSDAASRPPAPPAASSPAPSSGRPADFDAPRPPAPASPFSAADDLAGWDPDLAGDPARPEPVTPPPVTPPPVAPPPATPPPVAAAPIESAPPVAVTPPPAPRVEPPPPPPAPAVQAAPAPAPASAPAHATMAPFAAQSGPMPSLAEAFAALLAAEQGQHFSVAITPSQAVPDTVIEDIVRRVVARMTDQAVRETVGDVAERLVRDEIARIKGVNP